MTNARASRRGSVRARRRLKVTFPHGRSFTVELGAGGFSVEVLRIMPPGTRFDGSIEIDGRSVPFRGEVAWARAGTPYMGIPGRMGILFTSVPPEIRALAGPSALRDRT